MEKAFKTVPNPHNSKMANEHSKKKKPFTLCYYETITQYNTHTTDNIFSTLTLYSCYQIQCVHHIY